MTQQFQTLPSQQTPPSTTPSSSPTKQSFREKIRAHKTGILIGSVACTMLFVLGAYAFSPTRNTLVAPASIELPTQPPQAKPKTTPTPTLLPTTVPEPTLPSASWKLYNNSTYGYSIKYPPSWKIINLGALEPKIPSYVVINSPSASDSARNITISISTRTYTEQLALGASSSATTVGGILGTKQSFSDSDGNTSTVVTLPRTRNLLVFRAKSAYIPIFNQILATLTTTK